MSEELYLSQIFTHCVPNQYTYYIDILDVTADYTRFSELKAFFFGNIGYY